MKAMCYKWKGADRGKHIMERIPAGYLPQFNGGREFIEVENIKTGEKQAIGITDFAGEYQKY